jgi:hypothetical protein
MARKKIVRFMHKERAAQLRAQDRDEELGEAWFAAEKELDRKIRTGEYDLLSVTVQDDDYTIDVVYTVPELHKMTFHRQLEGADDGS